MKKLLLTTLTSLTILFCQAQTTLCDSLTITGSQYQLQITAITNTFIYYWETSGSDGSILEQDSSMSTTHSVYNFNSSTGQPYDTLITCISTMNTFCCATLVWDGNNWINTSGSNPPPPPPGPIGTCGSYTLELYDSFGDGWNGASLDININGAHFHNVTLATGNGPEIFTFATDSNDIIDLIYNTGSWDDENTYNLLDNSGNLIASQGASGFSPNLSPVSTFGIVACSNSSPTPLNCNANFYWWQDFDSTSNSFTTNIYCVENSTGGTGPFTYNWVFGDGNTSNLQYPTHVYNQVGDYNLCLTYTDANGNSSNYCDTVTISSRNGFTLNVIDESQVASLGIDNVEILTNSKIYPNPIGEQSFIEINSTHNLKANISYLDYSGKMIKSQNVSLINGFNKIKINALDLSSGIYFIKISNDVQNLNKTMKFIK
jgi:hypothetical protein